MNIGAGHESLDSGMLFFSIGPQFLLGTNNKAEDMFHTIFYANNQFSLKLAVKLIEVILNYNPKDQNIYSMRWWWMEFPRSCRLSYLCVSQCGQFDKELEENEMNLNFRQKSLMLQKLCRQYFSTFWSLFLPKYPVHKRQGKVLISPFFSPMHTESHPGLCLISMLH